jgi:uncharacterized membrane protein
VSAVNDSPPRRTGVGGLATLFVVAGVAHFAVPAWFDQIVPAWVPNARMATLVSGAAEIAGGIGLLLPATRRLAGVGLLLLLLAVFPANVNMLQMARATDAATWYVVALWARLPLQALLLWWVWKAAVRRDRRDA